ncbi:hypothetical protein ACOMHN_044325 [Nucella lapillus]
MADNWTMGVDSGRTTRPSESLQADLKRRNDDALKVAEMDELSELTNILRKQCEWMIDVSPVPTDGEC